MHVQGQSIEKNIYITNGHHIVSEKRKEQLILAGFFIKALLQNFPIQRYGKSQNMFNGIDRCVQLPSKNTHLHVRYLRDQYLSERLHFFRAKWGLYIFKCITAEDKCKNVSVSVWHLFLRSNRRREKQGRWSQTCISSLDSVLIHLLALTRHPRWANNTHKTRGSLKADNGNKQLRTKPAVSMNHWSWSLPPNHNSFWYHTCTPVHRSLRSWWPGKAWRYRGPGFLFSSGCWRASALVFPHHPDCYSIAPAQQELRSAGVT